MLMSTVALYKRLTQVMHPKQFMNFFFARFEMLFLLIECTKTRLSLAFWINQKPVDEGRIELVGTKSIYPNNDYRLLYD